MAATARGHIAFDQIRAAHRNGTGIFQMFEGAPPVAGNVAMFDAYGNVVDSGEAPGSGTGGGGGITDSIFVNGVAIPGSLKINGVAV